MALEFVVGTFAVSFLLLYIAFSLNKDRPETPIIRLLFVFIALGIMFFIPAHLLGEKQYCENLLMNTTTIGNNVTYAYEWTCEDPQTTTTLSLYNSYVWFLRIFAVAMIVLLSYWMFERHLKSLAKFYGTGRKKW